MVVPGRLYAESTGVIVARRDVDGELSLLDTVLAGRSDGWARGDEVFLSAFGVLAELLELFELVEPLRPRWTACSATEIGRAAGEVPAVGEPENEPRDESCAGGSFSGFSVVDCVAEGAVLARLLCSASRSGAIFSSFSLRSFSFFSSFFCFSQLSFYFLL